MHFTGIDLPVRLVNGANAMEGRVEVFYNHTWGTICDDLWNINDARVVCHQLGYLDAVNAYSYAHFGSGTGQSQLYISFISVFLFIGPIWLDNVACTGNEPDLLACSTNGLGNHNCGHYEDAGVACTSEHTQSLHTILLICTCFML